MMNHYDVLHQLSYSELEPMIRARYYFDSLLFLHYRHAIKNSSALSKL